MPRQYLPEWIKCPVCGEDTRITDKGIIFKHNRTKTMECCIPLTPEVCPASQMKLESIDPDRCKAMKGTFFMWISDDRGVPQKIKVIDGIPISKMIKDRFYLLMDESEYYLNIIHRKEKSTECNQ